MLITCRFIVGLGLGGELPVTTTLVTEFLPTNLRGRGILLLESFWAFGAVLAALAAFFVIPAWGWRVAFFLGALPALYVLYLRWGIPESPRYLARAGDTLAADRVVRRVAGEGEPRELAPVPKTRGLATLFSRAWGRRTITLGVLWLVMNFAYCGMFLWLPSVLVEHGYTLVKSLEYTLLVTLVQLPGYWSAAWLVDRVGRRPVLILYLVLDAWAAAMFRGASGVAQTRWFGGALSFFNLGAWGVTYTYTTEQYPTILRGTGTGWAMGVGRIGGIAGPFVVGAMLASGAGVPSIFMLFTIAMLVAALVMLILGRETARQSLEELSGEQLEVVSGDAL